MDYNFGSAGQYLTELTKDLGMTETEISNSMGFHVDFRKEFTKYTPGKNPTGSEEVARLYGFVQYLKSKGAAGSFLRHVVTAQVLPISWEERYDGDTLEHDTMSLAVYATLKGEYGWVANVELALKLAQEPESTPQVLLTPSEHSELTPEEVTYITEHTEVPQPPPPPEEYATFVPEAFNPPIEVEVQTEKPQEKPGMIDRLWGKGKKGKR